MCRESGFGKRSSISTKRIQKLRSDQYIETVLTKCDALMDAELWRREPSVRPRAWLHNFDLVDRPAAAVLLDHFVYFSTNAVDHMLLSLYRQMRDGLIATMGKERALATLNEAVFTSVEGEDPNITDSGNLFCRKLRQTAGINDDRFVDPARALQQAKDGKLVVFLDDILGSGSQIDATWKRGYLAALPYSFADVEAQSASHVIYATLVASWTGLERMRADIPAIKVVAAHVLAPAETISGVPRSVLRPDIEDIPAAVEALLAKYSPRLRVPPYLEGNRTRMYGHGELGLMIAFEHSTPDSTLPLFWADGSDQWTPLVRRV